VERVFKEKGYNLPETDVLQRKRKPFYFSSLWKRNNLMVKGEKRGVPLWGGRKNVPLKKNHQA